MLNEAQTLLFQAPMLAVYPGVAIVLSVLGLNLMGDGLRDLMDPKLARKLMKGHAMKIDFVSDVACPWCAVGLNALERALQRIGDRGAVELHFQPFELNPTMGARRRRRGEYLKAKYGMSAEQIAQNQPRPRERGAAVGFSLRRPRARVWNTFDAHRLLHWAGNRQAGASSARSSTRCCRPTTARAATRARARCCSTWPARVGWTWNEARQILAGDAYAAEVRERRTVLAAGRHPLGAGRGHQPPHLIQGGQPPEVFEQALAADRGGQA
jgi:hypothetical protein